MLNFNFVKRSYSQHLMKQHHFFLFYLVGFSGPEMDTDFEFNKKLRTVNRLYNKLLVAKACAECEKYETTSNPARRKYAACCIVKNGVLTGGSAIVRERILTKTGVDRMGGGDIVISDQVCTTDIFTKYLLYSLIVSPFSSL